MPDPTGFPQTYTDSYGHIWTSEEPQPNDLCSVCGVHFVNRSAYKHDDNGKAVPSGSGPNPAPPSSLDVARGTADPQTPIAQLEQQLRAMFEADLPKILAKAEEYGASDLVVMGKAMESLIPGHASLDPAAMASTGQEMALGHYALGKATRLFGAWEKGKVPNVDSWFDLGVYSMMARIVRSTGKWI